jgi:hypothetical protein
MMAINGRIQPPDMLAPNLRELFLTASLGSQSRFDPALLSGIRPEGRMLP